MQVKVHVALSDSVSPYGSQECLSSQADGGINFKAPQALLDVNFPVTSTSVPFESSGRGESAADIYTKLTSGDNGFQGAFDRRQNTCVYGYGQKATQKRQVMFGTSAAPQAGFAFKAISDIVSTAPADAVMTLSCYVLGSTENVTDLLDHSNEGGLIVDTVKEGPRVRNVAVKTIRSVADLPGAFSAITTGYENHFAAVSKEDSAGQDGDAFALPSYNPDHVVLVLSRYEDQEILNNGGPEMNSSHFIALGDSERPVLCGIDTAQLQQYEKAHKTLSSIAAILGAIRCNRLRVPFGKSKLSSILKRAYNAEKNNPYNQENKPTMSTLLVHAFTDDGHAEESYHTLALGRRIMSVLGSGGIGPMTRDLAVEKWRLEQDILELRDELTIARAVHDYKPCIYDQAKPVQNIAEEEQKRISAIQKRRDEARDRAQREIAAKAKEEAEALIEQEERKAAHTVEELQRMVEDKRQENEKLQSERTKKMHDYEKHLEKIRKKKNDEEAQVSKLKEEIKSLEDDLATQQEAIEKTKKQLEIAAMDQSKGREAILKERDEIKKKRAQLYNERRVQRDKWLKEIRDTNQQVLAQVAELTREREAKQARDGTVDEEAEETEQSVREDIESIDKYLPKLIALDDVPADVEATDSIRKQLEEYFAQEREAYEVKLENEKQRKAQLEKAVEQYRARIVEHQSKQKKELMAEAMKKESKLTDLVDQVVQYLQQGVRLCKVSSTKNIRKRFFFLSEDCRRIYACEIDEFGSPVNRRKPTTTIQLKDTRRIILGQYTSSFCDFVGDSAQHKRQRDEAMRADGSFSMEQTSVLTPSNLGRYQYRSFAFEFKNNKTLELVCEMDSDYEAWVVALKRLLNWKTPFDVKRQDIHDIQTSIEFGAPMDLRGRPMADKLSGDEASLCAEYHIAPQHYVAVKKDLVEMSQTSIVTMYDVRIHSMLDLLRSQILYEFLVEKRLIASIN